MANANVHRDWDQRYESGDLPWDSGIPSRELLRVIDERGIAPSRALELGCGTGTNAVALAKRGFEVTAVDYSPRALDLAGEKSARADVTVNWIEADVQNFGEKLQPFDFVFDRGCYHCCRRVDLRGYLRTLANVTRDGSQVLILAGNANEQTELGPPRVTEEEIRTELGVLMRIEFIREFHFEDFGGVEGPLGWSVYLTRGE